MPTRARHPSPPERGQILILTALCLTVVLGVAALSIDASFMYDKRNRLHAAADAAAISAALEVQRGNTPNANLVHFANREVSAHGFRPPSPTTVTVESPPTTGPFANVDGYVRVTVSELTATFFGGLLGFQNLTPLASATAGPSPSPNCVVALGPTSPGLHVGGTVSMPNCSVVDNTDLANDGAITAKQIAAGTCSAGCTGVIVNVPTTADPLARLPPPTDPGGPCIGGAPLVVPAGMLMGPLVGGKYCGWTLNAGSHLVLGSGLYYMTGPIVTIGTGAILDGIGVTIYMDLNPATKLTLEASLNLSAPTVGTYRGILFFQNSRNGSDAVVGVNTQPLSLAGAMYFPSAHVTTANNNTGTPSDCSVWLARSIDFGSDATLANTCAAFGGSPLLTVSVAE